MLLRSQGYDYETIYKPGEDMYVADTLYRAVQPDSGCEQRSETEKKLEQINMIERIPFSGKSVR